MEFRILIGENNIRDCGAQDCPVSGLTRELPELTAEESLALIKQLIEGLKCKECGGSGETPYILNRITMAHGVCTVCHGSGKDTSTLTEVVKLCFPEINVCAYQWANRLIGILQSLKAKSESPKVAEIEDFLDYLKE